MSEGPWDGSDLAPEHVIRQAPEEPAEPAELTEPPAGGGGGGFMPPLPDQLDEWPEFGVRPSQGGLML